MRRIYSRCIRTGLWRKRPNEGGHEQNFPKTGYYKTEIELGRTCSEEMGFLSLSTVVKEIPSGKRSHGGRRMTSERV